MPSAAVYNERLDKRFRPTTVVVLESSATETFTWTATVSPEGLSWLDVTPLSGSSGNQFTVTLDPDGLPYGAYQASIRVLADSFEVENHDRTLAVDLYVVDQVHFTYVSLVSK